MRINFTWPFQYPADGTGTGDGKTADGKGTGDGKTGEGTIVGDDNKGGAADGDKTKGAAADDKGKGDGDGKGSKGAADGEPKGKDGDGKTTPKAPEKYSLKPPDGGRLDESDLKTIEELARANDMTNDEAQGFLEEQYAVVAKQSERFLAATKADADYGGDKLEATQKLARTVVDRIRPKGHARREGFMKFIERGGAGNHIEVVSFLADLGKLMAEDVSMGGQGGSGAKPKDAVDVLYDKT